MKNKLKILESKPHFGIFKLFNNKTVFSVSLCVVFLLCWNTNNAQSAHNITNKKPNVMVILLDDLGYADVGFHKLPASSQVFTPNIDKLATSGITFTNGYVAFSTCGPSRASLLTGRSSSRFGVEENGTSGPPVSEIIVPKIISDQGYRTGAFGKWHLGEADGMLPKDRGFDYYWGDIGYKKDLLMRRIPQPPVWSSNPKPYNETYISDAYTDEVVAFIERNKEQPFFVYLAHNVPHSPFQTTRSLLERIVAERPEWAPVYERMKLEKDKWKGDKYNFGRFKGLDLDQDILRLTYISMILSADDSVGKIVEILEKHNLRDNTLIFFLSDNGAALSRPNDLGGVNLPLRSGKGSVYDGGVRVPFVMSWPGTLKQGEKSDLMVSSMDIFSTTIALAGGSIPKDRVIDGINLMPYLTNEKSGQPHEALFFRRKGRDFWAIRSGNYKWVYNKSKKSKFKDIEPDGGGLYQVGTDWTEVNDLSNASPKIRKNLSEMFLQLTKDLPEPLPQIGNNSEE
jgi:arylsulfatase A-like enzyme